MSKPVSIETVEEYAAASAPGESRPPRPGDDKPPKPKPPGRPGLEETGKTDEEISEEMEEELPTEEELAKYAGEIFLRLLPAGLSADHFQREPSAVKRQDVERLWRHALQIAEVWHRECKRGPKRVNAAVRAKEYRFKKFK